MDGNYCWVGAIMQLDNHTATYAPRKWTKQSVSASLEYVNAAEKRIQIFCISKGKSWDRDVDKETAFVDKWSYLRSLFSPIMGRYRTQRNYSRKLENSWNRADIRSINTVCGEYVTTRDGVVRLKLEMIGLLGGLKLGMMRIYARKSSVNSVLPSSYGLIWKRRNIIYLNVFKEWWKYIWKWQADSHNSDKESLGYTNESPSQRNSLPSVSSLMRMSFTLHWSFSFPAFDTFHLFSKIPPISLRPLCLMHADCAVIFLGIFHTILVIKFQNFCDANFNFVLRFHPQILSSSFAPHRCEKYASSDKSFFRVPSPHSLSPSL